MAKKRWVKPASSQKLAPDSMGLPCATAAALLGLECEIFMGKEDTDRQALNVYRMKLLGAKVHPVKAEPRP